MEYVRRHKKIVLIGLILLAVFTVIFGFQKKSVMEQSVEDELKDEPREETCLLYTSASEVQKDPEGYPNINPLLVFLTETDKGKTEIIYTMYDIDAVSYTHLKIASSGMI